MPAVTAASFSAPRKVHVERVDLAQWLEPDDFVWVRRISAKDIKELRQAQGKEPELGNMAFVYDLLHRALCDEDGKGLFTSPEHVADSFGLPVEAFTHISDEVLRIAGVTTSEKN